MLKVAGGTAAGNMATGASLLVSWLLLLVSALAGCAARDMSSRSAASLRGEIDRLFERFGSVLVPVAAPSVPHRAGMAQFVQPLDAAIDISEGDRHQRRQSTSAKTRRRTKFRPSCPVSMPTTSICRYPAACSCSRFKSYKNYLFPSAPAARSKARSTCRRASIAT